MLRMLQGAIGEMRHITSEFCMSASEDIERLYKRELGGGALLDIGVYPLSFIQVRVLLTAAPAAG